jgi:transposase-like protein
MCVESEFQRTEIECPECEEANIHKSNTESYCPNCAVTYGEDTTPNTRRKSAWERFEENRPTYRSGKKKCIGGFLSAYNWGTDENGTWVY